MRERLRAVWERLGCWPRRGVVILTAAGALFWLGNYLIFPTPPRLEPAPAAAPTRRAPWTGVTASRGAVVRIVDPFGLEAVRVVVPPASIAAAAPSPAPGAATEKLPLLRGIVDGAAGRAAIFEVAGGSVFCREGECVGAYRVTRIFGRAVELAGAAGGARLEVGR